MSKVSVVGFQLATKVSRIGGPFQRTRYDKWLINFYKDLMDEDVFSQTIS